jgi:hypothetical protein
MSLRVETRYYGGSGRVLGIRVEGSDASVEFAADPMGGVEAFWFCFKLAETRPEISHPEKVTLVLRFAGSMSGINPGGFRPVYQPAGKNWFRTGAPSIHTRPDGTADLRWSIPYPDPVVEVASCYPYGQDELNTLIRKCGGYWSSDEIGLTQEGRPIVRLSSDYGAPGSAVPGVYLVARQHAGETPGSWVVDGLADRLSREKRRSCVFWAVPLMDADGVARGAHGRDRFPIDMNSAWGAGARRHETLVVQADIGLWISRCKPAVILDFHARCEEPGEDGVLLRMSTHGNRQGLHKETTAWAHVIGDYLGREFSADPILRSGRPLQRWAGMSLCDYGSESGGVPCLAVEIPHGAAGSSEMTQKQFREIGRRIGKALLDRMGSIGRE